MQNKSFGNNSLAMSGESLVYPLGFEPLRKLTKEDKSQGEFEEEEFENQMD